MPNFEKALEFLNEKRSDETKSVTAKKLSRHFGRTQTHHKDLDPF